MIAERHLKIGEGKTKGGVSIMKRALLFLAFFGLVVALVPTTSTAATEEAKQAAIDAGLGWLATQQSAAGYWPYGGNSTREIVAATSSSLLPAVSNTTFFIKNSKESQPQLNP